MTAKSTSIKGAERKFGGRARKAVGTTWGGLRRVLETASGLRESQGSLSAAQKSAESRGEAPRAAREGTEPPTAKHGTESPASTEALMEEACVQENLRKALKRVRSNKGKAPALTG